MNAESARLAAPIAPTAASTHRPDILRVETFGALYYRRVDCSTWVIPPGLADLLVSACDGSILEAYARQPEIVDLTDEAFATKIAWWKKLGLVNDEYRCPAQLIRGAAIPGTLSAPLATHIRLTRACNLRCRHCYVETAPTVGDDELSVGELTAAFGELAEAGSPVVVLAGGEPLVRTDLFEILAALVDHGLDGFLCTNATQIDGDCAQRLAAAGLRGIQISLDGPDAETHDRLRGRGRFERALAGTRALVAAGADGLQLRVTVTRHNAARLTALADLAGELGVPKVILKPFEQVGGAPAELAIGRADYLAAIEVAEAEWPIDGGIALETSDGIPSLLPTWTGVTPSFGCVGGTSNLTIMNDAKLTACGSVPSPDDWSLRDHGLIESWLGAPSIANWRGLRANPTCEACADLSRCGGACRSRAMAACGCIDAPDPWAYCHNNPPV